MDVQQARTCSQENDFGVAAHPFFSHSPPLHCAGFWLQDFALKADKDRLNALESSIGHLKAHVDSLVTAKANHVTQRQQQLEQRLLRVMHIVEVCATTAFAIPPSVTSLIQ